MRLWLAGFVFLAVCSGQTKSAPAKPKPVPAKPKASPQATATAPAKAEPAAPAAYPLESVRITGLKQIPEARAIAASGLKLGAAVTKADFDKARDSLVATGGFENVGYEFKPSQAGTGFEVVFEVIETPQFFPVRFEDLRQTDALRAAIRQSEPLFDDKIPPARPVLDRLVKVVEHAAGVPVAVRVTGERGASEIVFAPSAGRPNIAEVRFTGNDVLPSTLLTRTLSAVAVGAPYSESGFRQMLDAALRPLYEARGRLKVEFGNVTSARAEKVDGVVITTAIREGDVYKLSAVKWEGVVGELRESMEKAADIRVGDIANFDDITNSLRKVNTRYLAMGFLKQTAKVDRAINDQTHEVAITVKVDPGPQYVMGKLKINGLDIFSEPAIRKIWRIDEGKPFPNEYPESFLNRIREEDLFDNLGKTSWDTQINDTTHIVDVTLNFSGARAEKAKQRP